MRHSGLSFEDDQMIRGPLVPPGRYEFRFNIDGEILSQHGIIRMDPRVALDGVIQEDLQQQFEFSLNLLRMRGEAVEAVHHIDSLAEESSDEALLNTLQKFRALLVTEEGDSYPQPMLMDQLRYLAGFTSRGDFRPGQDAYDRLRQLSSQIRKITGQLESL